MGGAERLLIDVVAAGRELGLFETTVYVLGPGDDLHRALSSQGIDCVPLGARGIVDAALAVPRLARALRRLRPDVVHGHLLHGGAVGLLAARASGLRPAVLTRHYERFVVMYGGTAERALHRVGHALADHVIAISAAASDVLVQVDRVPASRITVVHNGISVERIEREARQPRARPRAFTIGTVGSLHPRKGHEDLIRALRHVRPEATLVLIGDGPARGDLEELVAELGLAERVTFAGYEAHPYATVRALEIYAQPSREEGFGIAVLEAMALGRPVVATRAGGLPEIITDGSTGLLVTPGDPVRLAAALERLLSDAALRSVIAARGREHVATAFSAGATASGYAAVYARLLRQRPPFNA